MLVPYNQILRQARQHQYAVGAFNIYNLEGALAVIQAAEELGSPVIIQLLPAALALGGAPLIQLCLAAGKNAPVPVAVHLDHCPSQKEILVALAAGISSVMADGSRLDYAGNLAFTKEIVQAADRYTAGVEGELGRLSGSEDGLTVEAANAKMTRPEQAADFAEQTGISALAVCVGNVHGTYATEPRLDFDRLRAIGARVAIPLVLHGTSGLPDEMIVQAIAHGVCKFNVNTEVRTAYTRTLSRLFRDGKTPELVDVMQGGLEAMKHPIKEKIRLFGSTNKSFYQ
ncbi:class II fructose-bisphosphate aldolase [Desulfosarcina sp.]|uniref:class II fructose-bisphosphate aldolase n=1 Tax=Desulfosarcina sp. TaxID=2027861 RepID=UPI0029BEAE80|nr:class II fructose-bisphosphate aldolase [Desulfosarcina sp.]MDX2452632.1 class II fructose-bisphosphate aldolase [Desulfosarcina sp.]